MLTQCHPVRATGTGLGDHVADQPPLPWLILARDHRSLGDRGMGCQDGLDFPGLDPEPPRTFTCPSARPANTSCP